jgi:hypothetical protein
VGICSRACGGMERGKTAQAGEVAWCLGGTRRLPAHQRTLPRRSRPRDQGPVLAPFVVRRLSRPPMVVVLAPEGRPSSSGGAGPSARCLGAADPARAVLQPGTPIASTARDSRSLSGVDEGADRNGRSSSAARSGPHAPGSPLRRACGFPGSLVVRGLHDVPRRVLGHCGS